MSQLFSTEALPASDRIDAWQWNAQQICGDCRIQLPKSSFHGSIEVRNVGGLRLTRFSTTPLSFWKWPLDTVNLDNRSCIVITQIAGVRRYLQNGASVLLKPGDSTVIDSGRPWSSSCGTDCTRFYFRVPRWMMENRLRMPKIPIARRINGSAGLGATLCRLSQSIFEEAERMQDEEGAAALDAYFGILAGCLGGAATPALRGPELYGRIQRFVDAHISEPTLGADEIAAAMGISVRHLHRLYSVTGTTVGDSIRSRRLEHCRSDLANPRWRERSITEIAFSWGFNDSAHFSHSFRRQFGVSPRAFRAQIATRDDRISEERVGDALSEESFEFRDSRPN
jgi:AraC family transcriptional regulator, positive regulator of tynA and feaB